MKTSLSLRPWILAATAVATLAACGGGGGGTADSGTGTVRFAMTDAPACGFDHVFVTVEKVRVHANASASDTDAGWSEVVLATPKQVDLLALTNGVLEELGQTTLAAGHYSQVRLVLASNGANGASSTANAVQPTGGALMALATPSGAQSGLKLQANITVESGQTADLVLDFDACRSVVRAGNSGNYILKPVVSVVPRISTGVTGSIATTMPLATTTISAQQNGTTVRSTTPGSTGTFSLPFLPAGSYTVVITADGRATGVITGVTVGSSGTVALGSGAIELPTSAMAEVSGAALAGTTAVTDATVRATQAPTGGPVIEVKKLPVDATLATYRFSLPVAAPVKAAYSSTTVGFTADTGAAGKYAIEAAASGRTTVTQATDVTGATAKTVNLSFAP